MRTHMPLLSLALALALSGCSMFGGKSSEPAPSPIEQDSKDAARAGDQQMIAAQQQMDAEIDRNEAEVRKAVELALGKAPAFAGGQTPYPASQALAELRKAKIDLYFSPVLDAQGKPVADQFVELHDSYTDKVQTLSRKIAEQKATKKEMKFVQDGAKHVVKLNDLKAQVRAATMPAMQAGWMVTTGSMTTMSSVASMVRTRRQMEMEWTEEDYEMVRQLLERQSRRESLAAVSIGLLASYQVIIGSKKTDPKLLDDVANGTLQALPLKGEATIEQAKEFVANFEANVDAAQQLYEQQMRKTYGDAEYEAKYKAQLDQMFAQMKSAASAKSATEQMAETNAQYKADLEKCARGEKPGPGSLVGPGACKDAKAKAGPGGQLSPEALQSLLGGQMSAGSMAKTGIAKVLDMLPGGGAIKRALEGIKALRDGDASKALQLAADLVPIPGPAKMALNSAAKIAAALPPIKLKRKGKGRG